MNFISKQNVASGKEAQTCSIMHFNESIQKFQDGDSIAPHKRKANFLQDETQKIWEFEKAPQVEDSTFVVGELREAYVVERVKNPETFPKLYPIEESINGEDGKRGYRYLIFPILNETLYLHQKIFSTSHFATNLDKKYQTKYLFDPKKESGSMFAKQKITIPQVSRIEGTYVYIAWIYVWSCTLWMQDDREKYFRLIQVLKVIADLKAEYIQRPQLDLFFLLIEASYRHGNMKMTQKIYDTLPKYDLKPDARIQQRYMDHNKITEKKNKLLEE